MQRALVVGAAIALALAISCRIPDEQFRVRDAAGSADAARVDAAVDARAIDADLGPCDLTARWGPLVAVPGLPLARSVARFTADEMTAYLPLGSDGTASTPPETLFVATRAAVGSSFGTPIKLTNVNTADGENIPAISSDGTTLFYTWGAAHTNGADRDIYTATRTGSASQFGPGTPVSFNSATTLDDYAYLASNGDVYFASLRGTDTATSLYRANYVGGGGFGMVDRLNNVNSSSSSNIFPLVSANLLEFYFMRGGLVFRATRITPDANLGIPGTVDEINADAACTGVQCRPAWISTDGCRLYIGAGPTAMVTMYVTAKPANP